MKKLLFASCLLLSAALTVSSCKKDKDPVEPDTTYTFKQSADIASGVTMGVMIFEYNDGNERVGQQSFEASEGLVRVFTASSRAIKVKVRVTLVAGSTEMIRWIQQVFYLEKGENIDIEIKSNTLMGTSEP